MLCPEYYTARAPLSGFAPSMTIQSSVNYTVSTTASGSQVMILNPWQANIGPGLGTIVNWYC